MTIRIYNRRTGRLETERVFQRSFMHGVYGTALGRVSATLWWSRHGFSRLYGAWQRTGMSRRKIRRFVERYEIDCTELDRPIDAYASFDEFFQRRLKPAARPIDARDGTLISPADARLMAYPIGDGLVLPVKGSQYSISRLSAGEASHDRCDGGWCLVFRLAPVDYHRFCYIDDGDHDAHRRVPGRLHSVSPLALHHGVRVFQENQRDVVALRTTTFGTVIEVDVGALAVGRILQHHESGCQFRRGAEKGVFAFGGSTVVLLFERDRVAVDHDILAHSQQGIETLVRYGEAIGLSRAPERKNNAASRNEAEVIGSHGSSR